MRLLERRQFLRLRRSGKRQYGKFINIESRFCQHIHRRLGITVTRKFGKAVLRNRFKRVVREAFRLCYHLLSDGLEVHVRPGSKAKEASPQEIFEELLRLLPKKEDVSQ